MFTRRFRLASAMVFATATGAAAQRRQPLADSVQSLATTFFQSSRTPGLAVGVWKDGVVILSRGYGIRSPRGDSVTPQTVFHIASISKTFVAISVMQLVAQGKLILDAPVIRYLKDFRLKDPRYTGITLRQLLTHTSGLPDVTDYGWNRPEFDDAALARWIATLADSSLVAVPGQRWEYSNIGFELLAHLVATVSGESFEAYVKRHILDPAGMTHSTFLMPADSTTLATGYELRQGQMRPQRYPYNRSHAGSSTMHSTVEDMLRYGAIHVRRGVGEPSILPPSAYDTMWTAGKDVSPVFMGELMASHLGGGPALRRVSMGLGWFLMDFDSTMVMNHDGGDLGFSSSFFVSPDRRFVVVILENSGVDVTRLGLSIVKTLLRPGPSGVPAP